MVYIYALRDPESGSIRYIGKTKHIETRLAAHISKAKGHHTDHHCAHWVRSLLAKGLQPELVIVKELAVDEDWKRAEAAAIVAFRSAGHDLTNLTGGGDGFHDCPPDVLKRRGESRRKTLSDPVKRAEFVERLSASKQHPDVRRKQSDSAKALWASEESRSRMLAGMRKAEAVTRRSEATRRRMRDPESASQHRDTMNMLFQEPGRREQLDAARNSRWSDPDARAKHRACMASFYSDPERRKAAGLASRKRWDKPRG